MAEIRPLRAWRYNDVLSENIEALTSPLFDVVSAKHRQHLYQNNYNSIHLSVPQGEHPAEHAAALLASWKKDGILKQDEQPGIYVYYQYFTLPNSTQALCRKGFICNIRIYEWEEGVILRHENTIPKSVNDRIDLLKKTEFNVSATHGLYTDETFELEQFMDEAIKRPLYETEDYQGVRDVLAVITDAAVVSKFVEAIKNRTIILADGHHRYEGSLVYKQQQQKLNATHSGNEGYNFHMMYLTNTETGGYKILPTHRLVKQINNLREDAFLEKLSDDFIVKPVDDLTFLPELIAGKHWTFGVVLKERAFKITLKENSFHELPWQFPAIVKALDLTVMHYFIIEKNIGIPGKAQRQSEHIDFDRSFSNCLTAVANNDAQVAIITNEISIEEIKKVCESGYTMPQKSTYFYPKVVCGLLFSSIKENEF